MSKAKNEDEILKEVFQNLANHTFGCSKINNFNDLKTFFPNFVKYLIEDEQYPEWKKIPDEWIGKPIKKRMIDDIIKSNNSLVLDYLIQKDKKSFQMFKNSDFSDNDLISIICKVLDVFLISQSDQNLVNKISRYLKDTEPILQIRNMTSSWINGVPLIALISKASNGSIIFVDDRNLVPNYNFIKESFQKLKIPFVLTEDCILRKQQIKLCNRIQTALFFKSINFNDEPEVPIVSKTTENLETLKSTENIGTLKSAKTGKTTDYDHKRQEEIKKYEKKIEEYNDAIHVILEILETEKTKFEELSKCSRKEDVQTLRDYCITFIRSKKAKYQQQIFDVNNNFWNALMRRSGQLKMPIPNDLIKIEEVKQKFDHLAETIKIKSENIENEETKINKYYEEINNINNIVEARAKYDELKERFDIDKWTEFNKKSFIYILGNKLQKYEDSLKNMKSEYEIQIKKFKELHDSINNEIQKSSENLINMQNSISKLHVILNDIENAFNNIILVDPSFQNDISEIRLKIEYDNVKYNEYINDTVNKLIEKEINSIDGQLINISIELKEFSKYDNQYSAYLYSKVKNEHPILFPNYEKLENLLTFIPGDSKWQVKIDEIKALIASNKQEYDAKIKDIQRRQEECSITEEELNKLKKCLYISIMDFSFYSIREIIDQINIAENRKNWNENAIGTTINLYNESMVLISQEMNKLSDKIKKIFDDKLSSIKDEIENELLEYINSSVLKEHAYYDDQMKKFREYQSDLDYMRSINEMINLNINNEIEESATKINETIDLIQQKINDIQLKIKERIELKISEFVSDQQKEKEYLISRSQRKFYNSFDIDGNNVLTKLIKFDEFINELTIHSQNYKLNFDIPNTDKIKVTYFYLYIIYKSSLLLNPNKRLEMLKANIKECKNQNVTICACSIYVNIFRNKNFDFEINEEDLVKIEEYVQFIFALYFPFGINVLKQIQRNIVKQLNEYQMYDVEILCESIKCMAEPELYLLNSFEYLHFIIKDNDEYLKIKEQMEKNSELTKNDQLIKIIMKFSSLLNETNQRNNKDESFLFIDFGSFKKRVLYFIDGVKIVNTYYKRITFADRHNGLDNPSDEKILKSILKKYSNEKTENIVVCLHDQDEYKIALINEVISQIEYIKNLYFINPYAGIINNEEVDSGIVVDLGDNCLTIIPVFECEELYDCSIIHRHCGNDIALTFQNCLKADSCFQMDHIKYYPTRIKELKHCVYNNTKVRLSKNEELKKYIQFGKDFITADGSIQAPETILFNSNFNLSRRIIDVAKKASEKTNQNINTFLSNIVLVGGVAKTKGLVEKLKMDIGNDIIFNDSKYAQVEGAYTMALLTNYFSSKKVVFPD